MEKVKSESNLGSIVKGVGSAIILTIICLSIFSVLLSYTNLSENFIQPVVIVVTGMCILIGSLIANRKRKKNGIINGIIIGAIYISLIYITSSVASDGNFSLSFSAVIMMLVGILGGAIGGIIGVNI